MHARLRVVEGGPGTCRSSHEESQHATRSTSGQVVGRACMCVDRLVKGEGLSSGRGGRKVTVDEQSEKECC